MIGAEATTYNGDLNNYVGRIVLTVLCFRSIN